MQIANPNFKKVREFQLAMHFIKVSRISWEFLSKKLENCFENGHYLFLQTLTQLKLAKKFTKK